MRLGRIAAAVGLVGGALVAGTGVAVAHGTGGADTQGQPPWIEYHAQPWVDAPGEVCSFGVKADIVRDEERYRQYATYPDGSPKVQWWVGALDVRYTNTSTGESVVRDLGGDGLFAYDEDGGFLLEVFGPAGARITVGSIGSPPGEWVLNGRWDYRKSADGTHRQLRLFHGTEENICDTLA